MDSVTIVKIGGSLISHKNAYCSPNIPAIQSFIRTISQNQSILKNKLILVLGGGSYGNGVPIRYNLQNSSHSWQDIDLAMMTVKMFEWMTKISMICRDHDLPCYPFQTSSYLVSEKGKPLRFFVEPIIRVLSMGLIPVLSGDLVFDSLEDFVIFSSDGIPELFIEKINVKRIVMLTNVPGVLSYSSNLPLTIPSITKETYKIILEEVGASEQQDVTGGMKNKVKALLRLAERGIESVICDGRDPSIMISAIQDPVPKGTVIESWKKKN